jgi:hypothetical protein
VAIEAPVPKQPGGLGQGLQFGMTKGIGYGLAPVAAPANGPSLGIKHNGRNGHLPPLGCHRRSPQQTFHPSFQVAVCEGE